DGRPGDRGPRDRDVADRDGRPGDRGPRDRDRDGDRRGRGLVTSVDELTREGRGGVRTRELSESDRERIRNRSEQLRSRRDNIIADTNGEGRRGPGQGRDRGIEGRTGVEGRGQFDRGRTRAQTGADVRVRSQDNVDARTRA